MDPLRRILRESQLPAEIGRRSIEGELAYIDSLLMAEEEERPQIWTPEFLQRARCEMERVLQFGYSTAKFSVLVPVGAMGLPAGLNAPDLDIPLLGIGSHRYFLFHSALGLAVLRRLYISWVKYLDNPETYVGRVMRKTTGVLLGTFAAGVGIHLAIDVFEPKAVIFPFFGSLIDGTLIDDNLWLLGNSLWAFRISRDIFTLVLADELKAAKEFIKKNFGKITWEGLERVNG